MGCSSGSIENAHLIVVPSCGHWSRAGPPPGGPCLERQSRGLSNPQPFPPEFIPEGAGLEPPAPLDLWC
jgi:hypothetical protein